MKEATKKVCIITLGCKVNQCESDEIARQVDECKIVKELEKSDVYIINTCAVTQFAEKKSRYQVSRILRLDPQARIIVCGCASQLNAEQFGSMGVKNIFGADKSEVAECVKKLI